MFRLGETSIHKHFLMYLIHLADLIRCQNANQTIAWLGPAEEQSDEVIDFLGGFGEESHRLRIFDLDLLNQAHWSRDEKGKEKLVLPKGPLEDLVLKVRQVFNRDRGLKQLTSRPWWSRIWVKQELYVSTDVSFACGMRRISYDHLSSALMLLNICMAVTKFDDMDPDVVLKLDVTTITSSPEAIRMLGGRRSFQKDGRVPLAQLLISSSVVEDSRLRTYAADGRDRIYSILGLSTNAEELGITTDYSKSCREVYIDVANALLRHGDLEILTMCRSRGEVSGLPSWVPDWTAPILVPWMGMPRDKLFAASGDSQHSFIPSTRRDTVTLKGVRVDTIVDCGNPRIGEPHTIRENFTVENLLKEFNELERFVLRGSTIASENRANAVWRIPIADREVSRSGSQSHRATAISESMYRRMRKVAGIPIDHDDGNDGGGNGVDRGWGGYLLRMNEIHNRRPFLSEKGYVGLAPANAAVGDLICILYGAPVPFVLRKKVEEDHQLIGEAYVYGIMDGEFLRKGDAVSEEFVLH